MILASLDEHKQQLIRDYLNLVIQKNKSINLTAIESYEQGITLHVEDSLSCLEEFSTRSGLFVDIGTGGGFPGVPLSIASGRSGVLIDSVKKKARAVQEMVDELHLSNQITALGIRSEELALQDGPVFETAVARAVSSLPVVEELATPLLVNGGILIALRGHETDESIYEAEAVAEKLGLELVSKRRFLLDNTYERNIVVFEKFTDSSISLPRRVGMAQKRPLSK